MSQTLLSRPPDGWALKVHYVWFVCWCLFKLIRRRPNAVYCSDAFSYPVGYLASFFLKSKVVLHEHDPPDTSKGLFWRGIGKIRRMFAKRAEVCVIPQSERAARFAEETGAGKVLTVFNCPALYEIEMIAASVGSLEKDHGGLSLWYHGSLGPGQFPLNVLRAMARIDSEITLQFAGYETINNRGFVGEIISLAHELEISDRVQYLGAIPDRISLYRKSAKCDVGLCLFSNEFRDPMVGASNKPFDYLASGLPILTNSTEEWVSFFGRKGVSRDCNPDEIKSIQAALTWLVENKAAIYEMRNEGEREIAENWNYEKQFEPVLELLEMPYSG